jgi:hypothetical protein
VVDDTTIENEPELGLWSGRRLRRRGAPEALEPVQLSNAAVVLDGGERRGDGCVDLGSVFATAPCTETGAFSTGTVRTANFVLIARVGSCTRALWPAPGDRL